MDKDKSKIIAADERIINGVARQTVVTMDADEVLLTFGQQVDVGDAGAEKPDVRITMTHQGFRT